MQTNERLRLLTWQNRIKLLAFLCVIALVVVVVFTVKDMLLSVVIALIINYLLSPFVAYFEVKGFSRWSAVTIVFLTFTALVIGGLASVVPFLARQVASLQSELPKYIEGTVQLLERWQSFVAALSNGAIEVDFSQSIQTWTQSQGHSVLSSLPQFLSSSASVLVISPFIGFFMLKDGRQVARAVLNIVPNSIFEMILNLQYQINEQIAQYFRARFVESIIVGGVVFLGLFAIGFPYASVLALFAATTNLIPYVGPIVGAIPAFIIAVINQHSELLILLLALVYAVAQLIDMLFIIPLVVAKIVDLHPVTVVIAVIIGAQLLGVLGMLISIPVFCALKVTTITVYKHLTDFG